MIQNYLKQLTPSKIKPFSPLTPSKVSSFSPLTPSKVSSFPLCYQSGIKKRKTKISNGTPSVSPLKKKLFIDSIKEPMSKSGGVFSKTCSSKFSLLKTSLFSQEDGEISIEKQVSDVNSSSDKKRKTQLSSATLIETPPISPLKKKHVVQKNLSAFFQPISNGYSNKTVPINMGMIQNKTVYTQTKLHFVDKLSKPFNVQIDKLKSIIQRVRTVRYCAKIKKAINPVYAIRKNSGGTIFNYVLKNCYFSRQNCTQCDSYIPFELLNTHACTYCKKNGFNILGDIKQNFENIFVKCTHSKRISAYSRCLASDTGFVSLKKCDVDHIVPIGACGIDDLSNMQLICSSCNRSKGKGFSMFDYIKEHMFHPRFFSRIKMFLHTKKINFDVNGFLKMSQVQLNELNKYCGSLIEQFRSSSTYMQTVQEYIEKFHPRLRNM